MFPVTITLHNIADLTAVMSALGASAVVVDESTTSKPKAEAPGKRSAATPAPSPRTAEAAPSTPAPSAAAPATSTEPPAAPPSPATTAGDTAKPVAYSDLQKAVLTLHKADPTAAVPIAKSLGADTFKALPEDKWAEALRLVNEAIETRKVA